jgi:hypothetical protein
METITIELTQDEVLSLGVTIRTIEELHKAKILYISPSTAASLRSYSEKVLAKMSYHSGSIAVKGDHSSLEDAVERFEKNGN